MEVSPFFTKQLGMGNKIIKVIMGRPATVGAMKGVNKFLFIVVLREFHVLVFQMFLVQGSQYKYILIFLIEIR